MTTPDGFVEAYDAWKRASDQHAEMMAKVMAGDMLDVDAMQGKIAEIDALHSNWMNLAYDFAKVKAPEGSVA